MPPAPCCQRFLRSNLGWRRRERRSLQGQVVGRSLERQDLAKSRRRRCRRRPYLGLAQLDDLSLFLFVRHRRRCI